MCIERASHTRVPQDAFLNVALAKVESAANDLIERGEGENIAVASVFSSKASMRLHEKHLLKNMFLAASLTVPNSSAAIMRRASDQSSFQRARDADRMLLSDLSSVFFVFDPLTICPPRFIHRRA